MGSLFTFLMPFSVAIANDFVWRHLYSHSQTFAQIWTGVIVLCGLLYASGTLPYAALKPAKLFRWSEASQGQHRWVIWVLMSGWSIGCMVALLTLPTGSFLKLLMPPVFFGQVWCSVKSGEADHSAMRKVMLFTSCACAACVALLLTNRPLRLARLLGDWTGERVGRDSCKTQQKRP